MNQEVNETGFEEPSSFFDIDDKTLQIYNYCTFSGLCQTINIFGIATNIINIVCFVKQGFTDAINVSLIGLAISDLCSLMTMAWTCVLVTLAFVNSDLPIESIEVAYLASATPHFAFTRVSSCITAMITLERCISVVAPLKVKVLLTPKRTATVIVSIFFIFTFSGAPVYVVNQLGLKFSTLRNKTVVGLIFRHDKLQVEKFALLLNNFLIPLAAFVIVAVCTIILTIQLRRNTVWRNKTMNSAQADRLSSRNQKVGKMIVTIATLFIVCFVPTTIVMLALAFEPALSVNGRYVALSFAITGISYVMESVNSSMNIFIYHHMSINYRTAFRKLFSRGNTNVLPMANT